MVRSIWLRQCSEYTFHSGNSACNMYRIVFILLKHGGLVLLSNLLVGLGVATYYGVDPNPCTRKSKLDAQMIYGGRCTSGLTSYSIAACTDFGLCMVDDSHCVDWTGLDWTIGVD